MRRALVIGTVVIVAVAGVGIWRFWATLFGPGTWGSGGNMVAWAICGGLAFGWTWLVMHERHVQALVQAAKHHQEQLAQAEQHHQELKRHITAHCTDLKAHVSTVAESQVSGGSTPFDSRERLDGPPAISQAEFDQHIRVMADASPDEFAKLFRQFVRVHGGSGPDAVQRAFGGRM